MAESTQQEFPHRSFVQIKYPVRLSDLPHLGPECRRVQLAPRYGESSGQKPSERDFQAVAEYLTNRPQVVFRVYGSDTVDNLEYLRFFKNHHRFEIDLFCLQDFDGLRHLSDGLESLFFGATKATLDLSFLRRFKGLKELHLEGHRKNIHVLSELTNLEYLSLRSATLKDLSLLLPLHKLLNLEIRLGGIRNLQPLWEIGRIRYLHLWKVLGLSDLSPVGKVVTLQNLFLQALPRVTRLPELTRCKLLRRIVLYQMKGVSNLEALSTLTGLRELAVLSMPQLNPQSFSPLSALTTLERVDVWLRNRKKHHEISQILGPVVSDKEGEFSSLLSDNFRYQ